MSWLLVKLVDGYRRFISPALPPMCRFDPSCSAYAREALLRHGALKGSLLAIWRVLRCNPFGRGGYDPVPDKGRWRGNLEEKARIS
jgi:hypothetical protein